MIKSLSEYARGHMEHVRSILLETIQLTNTADRLWISDVCEGFISPTLLGPATYDSWRINLQFTTPKDALSERLESLGFQNTTSQIASILYSIAEKRYCVIQNPVGLPGAQSVSIHMFDNPAEVLQMMLDILARIDYENVSHFPISTPVKKAFKQHWYDRIVLSRTIHNKQHVGMYEDTLAIVTYGDETILRPLNRSAKLICAEHLHENMALPKKLGGYVLPKKWKPLVQALHEECRGYVLYLSSIHG